MKCLREADSIGAEILKGRLTGGTSRWKGMTGWSFCDWQQPLGSGLMKWLPGSADSSTLVMSIRARIAR